MLSLEKLKSIYSESPLLFKKIYAAIPWRYRMGKVYRETYAFLERSETWNADEWHEYQTEELKRLFYFCSKNIPYYQSLFKHHNVDPCAKDIWAEYAKLPYLSKDITRSEGENIVASNIKKNGLYVATTGGTTGKPVAIKFDNSSYKSEWAYKVYLWNRAIGYTPQSKKATFRGVDQLKGSLYVENPIYNEIRFSPFKLESETDLKAVVAKLKTYRPEFLHGYPSAINQLVKHLKKENISLPSVKAIILISENIFTHQTDLFRTYFSCPVYSFYGLTERVVIASMDGDDSEYFLHPGYAVTDLVDDFGNIVNKSNVQGEIVSTGFTNYGMPLIKYRTGDYACYGNATSELWNMPSITEIRGRWKQEFLIGRDAEKVSIIALNMHSNIFDKLKKMQLYQAVIGVVQLNIVKGPEFCHDDELKIYSAYKAKLGNNFDVTFKYFDQIPLTVSGKDQYFITELK